jgi:ABC-type dipeptide/oligopeptide/nickel transport system ATPase component
LRDNPYILTINPEQLATLYLRHIHKRVHDLHFNYLGIVTGKHRCGKSLMAVSFCHALDPTFTDNIEERVVFYANDFMKALQRLKNQKIKGGCVVFDEAGVGFGSRD